MPADHLPCNRIRTLPYAVIRFSTSKLVVFPLYDVGLPFPSYEIRLSWLSALSLGLTLLNGAGLKTASYCDVFAQPPLRVAARRGRVALSVTAALLYVLANML